MLAKRYYWILKAQKLYFAGYIGAKFSKIYRRANGANFLLLKSRYNFNNVYFKICEIELQSSGIQFVTISLLYIWRYIKISSDKLTVSRKTRMAKTQEKDRTSQKIREELHGQKRKNSILQERR